MRYYFFQLKNIPNHQVTLKTPEKIEDALESIGYLGMEVVELSA